MENKNHYSQCTKTNQRQTVAKIPTDIMLINLIYWALLHKVRLTWEGKALECASHRTGRGDSLLCKPLHHSTFGWVRRRSLPSCVLDELSQSSCPGHAWPFQYIHDPSLNVILKLRAKHNPAILTTHKAAVSVHVKDWFLQAFQNYLQHCRN